MKPRILAVDDDPFFLNMAAETLAAGGYEVKTASDGTEALRRVLRMPPDLMILDLVMPGLDGREVCRRLKKKPQTAGIPLIIVTGSDKEGQEISCLDLGADDYLVKPVNFGKLLARCRALLRRVERHAAPRQEIVAGKLGLNYEKKTVTVAGREHAELTPKEFEVLYELVSSAPRAVAKAALYRRVWGMDPPSEMSLKTVEVHIRRIRLKLGWERSRCIMHTSGRGYVFSAPR